MFFERTNPTKASTSSAKSFADRSSNAPLNFKSRLPSNAPENPSAAASSARLNTVALFRRDEVREQTNVPAILQTSRYRRVGASFLCRELFRFRSRTQREQQLLSGGFSVSRCVRQRKRAGNQRGVEGI